MLKRTLIFILTTVSFMIPGYTFAGTGERVMDFSARYEIQKDASVLVTENITYDFGSTQRHGIYRTIPVKYKTEKGTRYIKLENIAVIDESGASVNFSKSRVGDNQKLKIGDASVLVSGQKQYKISYQVVGAINYFTDHYELYWNVTGNSWEVPIDSATATIVYPVGASKENSKFVCYQGASGSVNSCASSSVGGSSEGVTAKAVAQNLEAGNGLTFAAWFPKGLVAVKKPLMDSRVLLFVLAAFAVMAGPVIAFWIMLSIWLKRGRDPKGASVIVPEFTPPKGISPTEAGVLSVDKVEKKSLSAVIIFLATKGYLKINRINKTGIFGGHDYEIEFLKTIDNKITEADRQIITDLFDGATKFVLSNLKEEKAESISGIWKDYVQKVFDSMTGKGIYKISPDRVLKLYGGIAGGFGSAALISFFVLGSWSWPIAISLGLVAAVIGVFAGIMPAKTVEGVALKDKILGLREYMNIAEKDRMKILDAPDLNPQKFEDLLPFAIALGVEKQWAKQFEGIITEAPAWYSDPSGTAFNLIILNSMFDDFHGATGAAFAAGASAAAGGSSGFGGGGFSGGGFGGGGGGSW